MMHHNAVPTAKHAKHANTGSAVLVVLVLLACLALFLVANSSALFSLKQELKLIDQQQLKKYEPTK